ncbi:cytochrome c3 family protein [Nitrospirota bacterium]
MGYRFGWHRLSNVDEWKNFKVKYKGRTYCESCHSEKLNLIRKSPHVSIECENCHGPAIDHPEEPAKLSIDRSREQCLRCHAKLPYKGSGRNWIRGINNDEHNPDMECAMCHNPHSPGF